MQTKLRDSLLPVSRTIVHMPHPHHITPLALCLSGSQGRHHPTPRPPLPRAAGPCGSSTTSIPTPWPWGGGRTEVSGRRESVACSPSSTALLATDPAGIDALQVLVKCKVHEVAALPGLISRVEPPTPPGPETHSCTWFVVPDSESPSAAAPRALLFWVHSADDVCTSGISLWPFHPCNTYSSSTTLPSLHRSFSTAIASLSDNLKKTFQRKCCTWISETIKQSAYVKLLAISYFLAQNAAYKIIGILGLSRLNN
jgi:hypothetical protein